MNDIAAAHLAAPSAFENGLSMDRFNLGTGVGVSYSDVFKKVEAVTELPRPYAESPRRRGGLTRLYADAGRAQAVLGFPLSIRLGTI